jgi:hypothetical protein
MIGQLQNGSSEPVALGFLILSAILALQGVLILKFLRTANEISLLRRMVADWYEANLDGSGDGLGSVSTRQTQVATTSTIRGTDRYTLGSTGTALHIWERQSPSAPIRTYPLTAEGREQAETEWQRLEARLALLAAGFVLIVTAIAVAFLLPSAAWIRVTVAGVGGTLGLILIAVGLAQGKEPR